ncbi:MAG: hypothetical protein JKY53_13270 [Flavobacteriales bacterium]|nr:hypothetical protein [Flavobacteriales bacterium]
MTITFSYKHEGKKKVGSVKSEGYGIPIFNEDKMKYVENHLSAKKVQGYKDLVLMSTSM